MILLLITHTMHADDFVQHMSCQQRVESVYCVYDDDNNHNNKIIIISMKAFTGDVVLNISKTLNVQFKKP